jgi:hypothetical protein|eukprot:COSAG03_NODE_286_length_9393_cov_7.458145_3_plen_156_part_00
MLPALQSQGSPFPSHAGAAHDHNPQVTHRGHERAAQANQWYVWARSASDRDRTADLRIYTRLAGRVTFGPKFGRRSELFWGRKILPCNLGVLRIICTTYHAHGVKGVPLEARQKSGRWLAQESSAPGSGVESSACRDKRAARAHGDIVTETDVSE